MIRSFVAVELSSDLKRGIAHAQTQLRDRLTRLMPLDVRIQWVQPDSIHLTLKFLGDIAAEQVEPIREALATRISAIPPFLLEVAGLGVFPDSRAPRVLWIGLSGQSGQTSLLIRLAAEVEAALEPLGFPREARPFNPHLTLARIKERSREVGKVLEGSGIFREQGALGNLAVCTLSLMKSDLKPSGAIYTRLWDVPLLGHEER